MPPVIIGIWTLTIATCCWYLYDTICTNKKLGALEDRLEENKRLIKQIMEDLERATKDE
jgi:hypothetical protein